MDLNGDEKVLPKLEVSWDSETQLVNLRFNGKEFQNWDFVIAALEMAVRQAEDQRRMAIMNNMQRQQAEAAQAEAVRRNLRMG